LQVVNQMTIDSGQLTVDSGQWTIDSGQWTVESKNPDLIFAINC
jgi:hypothetical protein